MTKKPLGFWLLTALMVGNMVGAGVFLVPSALAAIGSISLIAWLFTSFGTLLLVLVFISLAQRLPKTGGPYVYARTAFGDYVGFSLAYSYWIAWCAANAGMAVALTGYVGEFLPAVNTNAHYAFAVKAGAIWLVCGFNVLGLKTSARVQFVTTILKLLPLITIAIVGLFFIDPNLYAAEFNLTEHNNWHAFGAAAAITLWAYIGFESATVPAGSATSPKAIKKAMLFGIIITALIYILGSLVLMGMFKAEVLANSGAPYALAATTIFGGTAAKLVSLGAIISIVGALNGSLLVQVQVGMSAAQDGLFLRQFAKTNRMASPYLGYILSALVVTSLLLLTMSETLSKQFTFIVLLSTFAFLIPYFITVAAYLKLLFVDRFAGKPIYIMSLLLGIAALVYSFWTMIGAGKEVVFYGTLLFFSAYPVYALIHKPG